MKKYLILDTIGNMISCAGGALLIISLCIDLDSVPLRDLFKAFAFMFISFGVISLGQIIANIDYFEGMVLSALIVVGAWIYKALRKPAQVLRTCHEIKTQFGTSKDTYYKCRRRYEKYIDSLYIVEDEENEEDVYEQSEQAAASRSRF